jgi:malonate transporter and related proteins
MDYHEISKYVILNPMVLSTLVGIAWAAAGVPMPGPVSAYLQILADALTACALFAIGLGVSIEGLRSKLGRSAALAAVKLGLTPLTVLGLSIALKLEPLTLTAAVACAAVPTAKTVYILSGEYHCEEATVAATISLTTLCSIGTLIVWIYVLTKFFPLA